MKIYNVVQGSPEWHALRAQHSNRGASHAPAMMGASTKMTRSELVRMTATGDEKEFSAWVQENLLDRGHAVEVFGRAFVEEQIGEELYPATIGDDDCYLLASFDGITMVEETSCEVKLWNEDLAAQVRAKELSPAFYWQLEQHFRVVPTLKRVVFVVTDGTPARTLWMEYRAMPGREEQLMAGWKQFDEDVANYVHVEVLPRAVATPTMALPALAIQMKGEITLVSNLALFGEKLQSFIDGIDKDPKDDQAFADAAAAVTILKTAEEKLEAAEASALAQTASVDEMRSTVALYKDLARTTRLMLDKLVEAKKKTIREDIRVEGVNAVAAHIKKLNERLGKPYMPAVPTDFATAMRAKKSIASLRDGMETEVARAKIAANAIADSIQINVNLLAANKEHEFLFSDAAAIVLKANDDFAILVKARIDAHKVAEDKRIADAAAKLVAEQTERVVTSTQAVVPTPAARAVGVSRAITSPAPAVGKLRPSDNEIIAGLSDYFLADESVVIAWLLDIDVEGLKARSPARQSFAA